jgi:hypothetical protein
MCIDFAPIFFNVQTHVTDLFAEQLGCKESRLLATLFPVTRGVFMCGLRILKVGVSLSLKLPVTE